MPLPIYFPIVENAIDQTTGLPVVKLLTGRRSAFGGRAIKNYLTPENSGGTAVAANHVGADNSRIYNTKDDVFTKMALLYNSHGNVVTPQFGLAITSVDQPFNFAGIAVSNSLSVSENWVQKTAAPGDVIPPQRSDCQVAYLNSSQRVILFGGEDNFTFKNDTWEYDGNHWIERNVVGPTARVAFAMTNIRYSGDDYVFLYGGKNSSDVLLGNSLVFLYSWITLTPGTTPGVRADHAIAWDSNREVIVLFGGNNGSTLNDTWEYDPGVLDWAEITTATSPSVREGHMMAYDSFRNRTVLFSGSNFESDTWEYDGTDWTQIFLPGSLPPARINGQMIYSSTRKKIVLFGGLGAADTNLSDTWEYDGSSWIQTNVPGPSAREKFGMAYDSSRDKVVLFGGANTAVIGGNKETWEFGSPVRPVAVQTSGDGFVYYDASPSRPSPVVGDFLGPSSVIGTITPLYDGYSPVFGIAVEPPVPLGTVLDENTDNVTTTITVSTTTGFPTSGTIIIDFEQIDYTGLTTTTFTGCTRGANSTTAAAHGKNVVVSSTSTPLSLIVNGSTVGIIKIRIRPFYGFIPPLSPSITGFSPSAGEVGTLITLEGTVFIGTTEVTINDTPSASATFSVISNNQITFTVPAGAQKGTITVTNAQGNSTSVSKFVTLPSISSIFPGSGAEGDSVTITGHAFTYATIVTFNGVSSLFSISDDAHIVTTIPAGGTTGNVDVTVTYAISDDRIATYQNFGVVPPPTISNVAPLSGGSGAFVAITGTGFAVGGSELDGYGTVDFIDVLTMTQILPATRTVFDDTTISAITPTPGSPQASTAYYVRVTTDGGTILSTQQYTIIPIPKFLDSPTTTFYDTRTATNSGISGDTVVILGDYGFTGISEVTFDGYLSPSINFVDDGYVTAIVPSISSAVDITGPIRVVGTGGAKSTDESPTATPTTFTIQQAPSITSISPLSGKAGDTVVITGTNLLALSTVMFYLDGYATFTIVNSATVNATVPADGSGISSAPTQGAITVAKGPFTAASSQLFKFYPPPLITGISPSADGGSINGGTGTSVTISGTNLNQGGTPVVTFGGVTAVIGSASPGSVICTVPTNAGNTLRITTLGGFATTTFIVLPPCTISSFYTDWSYDHHSATPYYPNTIDVYGSNFRDSPYMTVAVIDPAQGYASIGVSFTFYDSTHIRFTASALNAFSGGDTCYIQITTTYPGGSYTTSVYGLYVFYPLL